MSEEATTTTTEAPATPAPAGDLDLSNLLDGMLEGATAGAAAGQAEPKPTEAAKPATNVPVDPLAEELFAEEVLVTPEQAREAAKMLRDERGKTAELRKKALNLHGQAEKREAKLSRREAALQERETRVAAIERYQAAAVADLESGDAERFITSVGRLSKSADPASYWKKVSLKLASGGTYTEAEKKAVQADPELKAKVERMEQHFVWQQEQAEQAQLEQLKTANLHFAQRSEVTPYVALFAKEHAAEFRERLADYMTSTYEQTGQPIDIATACGNLEESLKAQYELFQRAGGNTDGEKGTAGSGPDAGRESSGEPPKPETATRAPTTVPASLTATQGQARRALTPREHRDQLVNSLPAEWWAQVGL